MSKSTEEEAERKNMEKREEEEQEEKRRGGADRKVNSLNRTFRRKTRRKMSSS